VNLEELERDVLRGARRELTPAASDRERHAELLVRLGTAHAREPLALGARTGSASAGRWGRASRLQLRGSHFGMLGVGLLVGAMVGGWLGFGLGQGWWGSASSVPSALDVVAPAARAPESGEHGGAAGQAVSPAAGLPAPGGAPPAGDVLAAPEGLPAPDEVKRSANEVERASRGAASARPRIARSPTPAAASMESSLAAELAMLQRARRALAAENGALALGIVEELDERFPKGLLLEERTATRVLSLCKLARVDAARREALRFLERYPASVYAERVRQSCAGPASE
jgi:hypothetical protein